MNYQKVHDAIINRARYRELEKPYERHHIVPRSLGGSNDKNNIVCLTFREHFLVHWLLTKITTGKDKAKMSHALHRLANGHNQKKVLSARKYEIAKHIKRSALLGSKASQETRNKMSRGQCGKNNGFYGKGYLISGKLHPMYGKKHSDETIDKIRKNNGMKGRHGKNHHSSKSIICLTDGKHWESIKEAAKFYDLSSSAIVRVCKKKNRHVKGYCFVYLENFTEHLVFGKTERPRKRRIKRLSDGKIYPSITKAAEENGISRKQISRACTQNIDQLKRHPFAYTEEK